MGYKAISQLVLIGVSLVIIFTFVKPTFVHISTVQDELFQYSDAVAKASEFNQLLNGLLATANSFSTRDMQALDVFLPSAIDEAQVMSDIEGIVQRYDVEMTSIESNELIVSVQAFTFEDDTMIEEDELMHQDFEISILGSYGEFKLLLEGIESNAYLLEIVQLSFDVKDESTSGLQSFVPDPSDVEYDFSLTLRVYSLSSTGTQ